MSRGYLIENRAGMPGAFVNVTDETPKEAREREAAREQHRRDLDRATELSQADAARRNAENMERDD